MASDKENFAHAAAGDPDKWARRFAVIFFIVAATCIAFKFDLF